MPGSLKLALAAVMAAFLLAPSAGTASPAILDPSLLVWHQGEGVTRLVKAIGGLGGGAWSPDGTRVVVSRVDGSLLLVDVRTGSRRGLDVDGLYAYQAAWSPDGSRIAFAAYGQPEGGSDIYLVEIATGVVTQLTDAPGDDGHPRWAPDGSRIAYPRRGRGGGIFVVDAGGGTPLRVVGNVFSAPEWSPDSTRLAFASGYDIWIVDADGSGITNLTSSFREEEDVVWSPEGDRIAYNTQRGRLWIQPVDGGRPRRVILERRLAVWAPAWSPTSERIAFQAREDIWMVGTDGKGLRNITRKTRDGVWEPVWSPTGRRIAFERLRTSGGGELPPGT